MSRLVVKAWDAPTEQVQNLLRWHRDAVKPFLEKRLPDKIEALDDALKRIQRLDSRVSEELAICFLGVSAVGKSTLINALVAGAEFVLPSGGVGPLTAIAMEVRYGDPAFEAEYHKPARLWQGVGFPLERAYEAAQKVSPDSTSAVESALLDPDGDEPTEVPDGDDGESRKRFESLRKQAQLLVKGNQDVSADLPYLLDRIREVVGTKVRWGTTVLSEDSDRVGRLRAAFALSKAGKLYQRDRKADASTFRKDLSDHASGFLAPLIKRLQVHWDSPLLKPGLVLVDLPGVGVANDVYKDATQTWITKQAKAVVLVVDRSGITESSADLLRASEFLTRMLFASDERADDPVVLAVAVARLDDVAEDEWAKDRSRKKSQHLLDQFGKARELVRSQLRQVLMRVWDSGDQNVRSAQMSVIEALANDLQVFPVSAPQYRRFLAQDDEDKSFITDAEESGIPEIQRSLEEIVVRRRIEARRLRNESVRAWVDQALASIELVRAQWSGNHHTEKEVQDLERDLSKVLDPKRKEFLVRQGQFREFLKRTMPQQIENLVLRAKDSARKEISRYLSGLRDAHWSTLRAAVRREGAFHGARHINLPDDFAQKFVEPVAEVWGKSIIQEIRKNTREFAQDCERMVVGLASWCRDQGARFAPSLLDAQIESLRTDMKQIDLAGREVIGGLRERVKNELTPSIQKPIRSRCNHFVKKGDDIGSGVKRRMLELFDELAEETTLAAADAATALLQACFREVEIELQHVQKDLENPLDGAAAAILQSYQRTVERSAEKERESVLEGAKRVHSLLPDSLIFEQKEEVSP